MMNIKNIELLLNKYWEAETSVDEENTLSVYFNSGNVDPSLEYANVYFVIPVVSEEAIPDFTTSIMSKLVDKYFEAETTIEEEAIIQQYFAQSTVANSLCQYKQYFSLLERQKNVTFNKELSLPSTLKVVHKSRAKSYNFVWLKAVAAIFLVAVGGYWIMNNQTKPIEEIQMANANYSEVEDPELALKYTMEALALVSKKYKKGEEQLLEGMKTMNEANVLQ